MSEEFTNPFTDDIFGESASGSTSDYTNLSGADLVKDRGFLDDVRTYYETKGQTFSSTSDMLDEWYTDRRWKDSNFLSAGKDLAEYANAGTNQQLMTKLSKAWRNAPERGSFVSQVWDYGLATVADPVNFIPYAGAASKAANVAKLARAAGATKNAAVKAAVKSGAKRGAVIEGGVGAGMGAGMDAIQQTREIQQGLSTEYDYGRTATSAAIEGTLSAGIGSAVGAFAARNPALEGLKWSNSNLAGEIKIQNSDIQRTVEEADAVINDPLRAPDHDDAREAKKNAELETAKINAHSRKIDALDAEVDDLAARMATEGGDAPQIKTSYDQKFAELQAAINSTEIPDIELGRAPEAPKPTAAQTVAKAEAEVEAKKPKATAAKPKPKTTVETDGAEAGDTGDTGDTDSAEAPVNTEATGDTTATTGDTPVEAAPEAEATTEAEAAPAPEAAPEAEATTEAEAEAAPAVAEVLEVPAIKGRKFTYDDKKDESLLKGLGKGMATHKSKVAKANEKNATALEPLTQSDLEKIVASTPNGTKDGALAPAGRKAIRRYLAAREGRVASFKTAKKNASADAKVDDASFVSPAVAEVKTAKEDFVAEEAAKLEAEVDGLAASANEAFAKVLKLAGNNPTKTRINKSFQGIASEYGEATAAAVRRRIDDHVNLVIPVVNKLKRDAKVAELRVQSKAQDARMYDSDLAYTKSRMADSTAKSSRALETDPQAGVTTSVSTSKKTGEQVVTTKVNSLLKPGTDIGLEDGGTITEGAGAFRRENETLLAAQSQAEMDVSQGKNKAVYSFPARAGMQLIGVKGMGRGKRGVATEGQVVYGAMTQIGKADSKFKVFATEKMALESLGLSKGQIGIDTSKIKPIESTEALEAARDEAYEKFSKSKGDVDTLQEELAVADAQGREGGLDVDPAPEVVVKDGRGNVVKSDIPDAPITRDGKVMVLLPRTTEVAPRVASKSQIADDATVSTLLGGKPMSLFRIGYVPAEINGKSAQSQATKRNLIRDNFEPLDEQNSFEFTPTAEPEAEMPARPLTQKEADNTVIDISALASTPEGRNVAQFLFQGDNIVNSKSLDGLIAPTFDEFLKSKPTLNRLQENLNFLERDDFKITTTLGDKEVEIPLSFRIKALNALHTVIKAEAPHGVKKPTVDIEASISSLKKVMSGVGEKVSNQIEYLLRQAVPIDKAPIFGSPSDGGSAGSVFVYGAKSEDYNKVMLDMSSFDADGQRTGITGSYTVMHELGHWMYENVLDAETKGEFWGNLDKFYDENGRFTEGASEVEGGLTALEKLTPSVEVDGVRAGVANGKTNPQEYFANQFSLYMHHKFNSPLATANANVLKKAARILQKLWLKMTNRDIIDPEMEMMFDKLIADKDVALQKQFTFPVKASTSVGKTLETRYIQIKDALKDFEAAIQGYPETSDPEKMATTARALSTVFNGMSMTKKTKGYLVRKAGNVASDRAALDRSTGVLKLMNGKQLRGMRDISKAINEATIQTDSRISQSGDDMEVFGGAYHSEMEASLVDLYNSKMKDFTEELKTSMNDMFMDIEYGDMEAFLPSEDTLNLRATYNINGPLLAKKKNFEQNVKREVNRQRGAFKRSLSRAMKATGKANAKEFKGDIVEGTKGSEANSYNLEEAVREYQRQIGEDGTPTEFGMNLAKRARHLIQTKVDDVNLTEEEQAIYHTWQSKTVGKGAKGLATGARIDELTMALSITIDGNSIKGVAGTPEQIQNITRHIIKERYQARKAKAALRNKKVSDAIEIEQLQEAGVSFENGIPQNANATMRGFLRGITHRSQDVEYSARTMTARLARLDSLMPQSTDDLTYKGFRKAVRLAGVNLTRDGDITQSVRLVSESLYGSNVVSQSSRDTISKYAAILGREPADVFAEILTESVDTLSSKDQIKAMRRNMLGDDLDGVDVLLGEIEENMVDALSYVFNGLISSPAARNRFYSVTFPEDLFSTGGTQKASTRSRYKSDVPSEYASDYAYELLDNYSKSARSAIEEFTGGNVRVFYINNDMNGAVGRGAYVTARPSNTLENMADDIISSAPEANQDDVADYVEALIELRGQVNAARRDPLSSSEYFERMYALDDALSQEIGELGARMDTNVKPVFIRDTTPAIFSGNMNSLSPIVGALKGHYVARVADGLSGRDQANQIKAIKGNFTAAQMLELLTDIAGGDRQLRDAMSEMGYTSLNIGPDKLVLKKSGVRDVRSQSFENSTPILGEGGVEPALNGAIGSRIINGADPIKVFSQGGKALEDAGVGAKVVDGMVSVARGRGLPKDAANKIRKSNIYNPLRTNSRIMKRSGMSYPANFFEPENGGGGHFERTNSKMGKFLMPMTRMLRELPDSGGVAKRYWQTGPVMMAESALGAVGFSPKRRNSQPISHMRIVTALRNGSTKNELIGKEVETYLHIRGYLDAAVSRLRAAGNQVGEIKDDYFPQVWRKDLIEADTDAFKRGISKYFMAENASMQGSEVLTQAEAMKRADRLVEKLLDQDGVLSSPSSSLKSTSGKGNEDSLDFQRMMRLDEFKEFTDFDNPDSLAPFLENDLLVAMTKYSDSIEHRIDLTEEFGPANHGYHDYMAILADPMHGKQTIATLLSSNKILKTNFSRMGGSGEGELDSVFTDTFFMSPIKDKYVAGQAAESLINKARSGASVAEMQAEIMGILDAKISNTPEAATIRKNFSKRAAAIANALVDTEGLTKITSKENVKHAQGFMNAAMRKPVDGQHGIYSMKNASKWLRGVNAVTLLSFTTLTSLADLVLPLIRTGDFKAYYTALKTYAREPAYREMIRNVGAATENAVHQRLTAAHGVDSTQFMTGFFNSTLLTPWTDAMRDVAAAVSYEHVKAQHRILREAPSTRQGRIARKILQQEGLQELIDDTSIDLDLVLESRGSAKEHPFNDKLSTALIKLTNQMIFTPNPNDMPLWGQTPLGAIALQLKSYPIMMQRMTNKVVADAFEGEGAINRGSNFAKAIVGRSDNRLGPLGALLVAGPAFGAGTVAIKDVVQGRGGEDNREFALRDRRLSKGLMEGTDAFEDNPELDRTLGLYFDGMVALGGMGFIGEMMYDIGANADNGAYGTQRTMEGIFGPTLGLFNDASSVLQGARSVYDGDEANGERRTAVREIVGRVPVLGGVSWAKEAVIDSISGERGKAGRPSSGAYGGGYSGGYSDGY